MKINKQKGFIGPLALVISGLIALGVLFTPANTENLGAGSGTISPLPTRIETLNEGVSLTSRTTSFDFTGPGVTATNTGNAVTVDITGGGGGGDLDDLDDVVITGVANGEVLQYNGTNWVNATVSGSGDVTAVGDCTSGDCFTGTAGTSLTFNNAGGDGILAYDGTDFNFDKSISLGTAGVRLSGDGDGAITFQGLGNGNDENLTLNLDDTNNTGVFTSSSGLAQLWYDNIDLQDSDSVWKLSNNGSSYFGNGAGGQLRTGFGGVTSPSAKIHVGAGTTSANTAPLMLTAGTNMTTPQAGAIEFDGTDLFYTDSGPTRRTVANSDDLHSAVTLAGEDYLSLSTQQITANAIDLDNLSATGTPSSSTFLRGDNTWATPAGGGGSIDGSGTTDNFTYWSDSDTLTSTSSIFIDAGDTLLNDKFVYFSHFADPTKKVKLSLSSISPTTTRNITLQDADGTMAYLSDIPGVKNSIEIDTGDLQLVGDSATPGNTKLYGTNGSGTKGWYDQPAGGSGASTALDNLASVAINTSLVSDTDSTDSIGSTGVRWLKGWFDDVESTNIPTVGGTPILTSLTAPQFTTIELGHASANTLSASGGQLSVEGVEVTTASNTQTLTNKTIAAASNVLDSCLVLAVTDQYSNLTVGGAKITFRMPYAMTLTSIRGSLVTAGTGGTLVTVDINETASTILSTKMTFDASEKTTTTAATALVISDTSLADDSEITVDVDAIGSTLPGNGLKISLCGTI